MIFQKKLDKAMKKLHEDSDAGKAERAAKEGVPYEDEMPELEKNDLLAMFIAAVITFLPVAIIVLGVIAFVAWFFLMR